VSIKFLVLGATDCETTVIVAQCHTNNMILTTDKSTCKWYIKTKQTVIGCFISVRRTLPVQVGGSSLE